MGKKDVVVLAVICVLAGDAAADRKVEAQQLFDEGKTLMAAGRHDEACPKFAGSHQLAPSSSTLMNLGACHEAGKRLATAWVTFKEAAALAIRTDPALAEPSRRRADALQPRLSSLRIEVPEASRIAGLEIMRNGVVLVEAQWNSNQYVDGGEYEIVARAPSTVAWTARISVANELDQRAIEIPRLIVDAAEAPEPERTPSVAGTAPAPPRFTRMRKASVVVGGLGVGLLGGGVYLGLRASSYQADSDAICPTTTCNDAEALSLNDRARSTGAKATLLFVAGGASVAAGVTLWIIGRPGSVGVSPLATDDTVGLSFTGSL